MGTAEGQKKVSYLHTAGIIALAVALPVCLTRSNATISWSSLIVFSPALLILGTVAYAAIDIYLALYLHRLPAAPAHQHAKKRWSVRPLSLTTKAKWAAVKTRADWERAAQPTRDWPVSSPSLARAISRLLKLAIRDFVLKWYSTFSDSPAFPNAVEETIRTCATRVTDRAANVDWSDAVVAKILPIVSAHLEHFRTAELALRGHNLKARLTESYELDLFVAERYALEVPNSKLHPAIDVSSPLTRPVEEAWLRSVIERILPLVMPTQDITSDAVRTLTREIVTCSVLMPILEMLSDPNFWNKLIDEKAGAAIRDQQMVQQFREALDQQGDALSAAATPASKTKTRPRRRSSHEDIEPTTSTKRFESFLRDVDHCNSLSEARRIANDVTTQIRRTKEQLVAAQAAGQSGDIAPETLSKHVDRLGTALKKVNRRIRELGGDSMASDAVTLRDVDQSVTLRDILLHPSALSHFMEFQERRKRSLLVRYWLLVEGLKDPLEDFSFSVAEAQLTRPAPNARDVQTAREDCRMIWDSYLDTNELGVNEKYRNVVAEFLGRDGSTPVSALDIWQLKRAIFASQRDVLAEMEDEDFPAFRSTDLYFKAASTLRLTQDTSDASAAKKRRMSFGRSRTAEEPRKNSHKATASASLGRFVFKNRSLPLQIDDAIQPRTETAPPQVSLEAVAFDRPAARRAISDSLSQEGNARAPSVTSLDSGSKRQGGGAAAGSLDFLIHSPGIEADDHSRSPLFDDDEAAQDEDPLTKSVASLAEDDYVQVQTIEAIQDALNSILSANDRASLGSNSLSASQELAPRPDKRTASASSAPVLSSGTSLTSVRSPSASVADLSKSGHRVPSGSSAKSMPEAAVRKGKAIFDDAELSSDESEPETDSQNEPVPAKDLQLALPGDLHLADEIARMHVAIERLRNQEAVVAALVRKAELTGNLSELKLLTKSRDSLRREEQALSFQKSQYELQENENKITPERTRVSITGTSVGQSGGEKYHVFLVEVVQTGQDGAFTSGWIVTRRYSDFANLHNALKDKYPAVRPIELPGKKLVTPYSDTFIEHRRQGLETYLRRLVQVPAVCQSAELRAFLSQRNVSLPRPDNSLRASILTAPNIVKSVYRSVASGIDDIFNGSPVSLMDSIVDSLSQQAAGLAGYGSGKLHDEDLVGQVLAEQQSGPQGTVALPNGVSAPDPTSSFTAPICDLFIAVFELKEKNNWLRRQAIAIVLQQVLGGTIERRFKDTVALLLSPDNMVNYLTHAEGALWTDGVLKPKDPPRTPEQKRRTRDSAHKKLVDLIPAIAASFIGKGNAKRGARRIFTILQNRRLNQHLIYSILDVVLPLLFPELLYAREGECKEARS